MRHGKRFNHLGRTASHRKALLSNMASSLIIHKRITTTVAKAKALRKYLEPLLTKSKTDTSHSRRVVFSYLQNKEAISELFNSVAEKIAERPGGYLRIIKTGNRLGDNADMCIIELVDYNELLLKPVEEKPKRRRRKKKSTSTEEKTVQASEGESVAEESSSEESSSKETEPDDDVKKDESPE